MIIVFITREKLSLYQAGSLANPACNLITESNYTLENFVDTFTQLKSHLAGDIRILLSDDLSYSTNITIPNTETNDRQFISQSLPSLFPEVLEPTDWDYFETSRTDDSHQDFVFAPVKPYKQLIDQAAVSLGLKINSFEPESIAKTRHSDPIIGAALKKDISGDDKSILNLAPNSGRHFNWNWVFIPLFLVLFIFGNIYLFQRFAGKKTVSVKAVPTFSPTPTVIIPTATPTVVTTKVQVLNGTGVPGLAGKLADQLRTLPNVSVSTGNTSPNFAASRAIFKTEVIKTSLASSSAQFIKITDSHLTIDNSLEFDAIFIIGKN